MKDEKHMTAKVRLDKWLWACRFFKTRSMAKQEIDGGKVRINGIKVKPSREVQIGDNVSFKQGWDEKTVEILKISDQRRGAPEAQTLYQETSESIQLREENAAKRKAAGVSVLSENRPTKKQRRQIHRFKRIQVEE